MTDQPAYRITPVTEQTAAAFAALDDIAWFDEPDPADDDPLGALDLSRCFAATRTGEPPFSGIYASFDQLLTIPGATGAPAQVPCAGLTWVAVNPDDRRTGVLTTMVTHHLREAHERGVVLGSLHASEVGIYGRFGYGQASYDVHAEVGTGREPRAPGIETDGIRTVLLDATAPETIERVIRMQHTAAGLQPGQVTLTEAHHRRRMRPSAQHERGSERAKVVVASQDGADVGYAWIRRTHKWPDAMPGGSLQCFDLVTLQTPARLALLRRLLSFDLIATVELHSLNGLDDEIIGWLGGPRAVTAKVRDSLWLRLIDVAAALEQRGCAADADLVLDVLDPSCPWNAGRWRLRVEGGRATCERTDGPADLRLPVEALGSAYVGGRSIAAMARQGLVEELSDGAVASLSRALASDVAPAAALMF